MIGRIQFCGSIIQAILFAELFQRFLFELQIIFKSHGYSLYNSKIEMSRKKRKGIYWGTALKRMRLDAGLNLSDIARVIYGGDPEEAKGNVSLIEGNKISIAEDKIRLWVKTCGKEMAEFYIRVTSLEGSEVLKEFPPKS